MMFSFQLYLSDIFLLITQPLPVKEYIFLVA